MKIAECGIVFLMFGLFALGIATFVHKTNEEEKSLYRAYIKMTGNPKQLTQEEFKMVKNYVYYNPPTQER